MQTKPKASLLPRIFPFLNWGREITRNTLKADFIAGLTGAVIVLPQGVAFAMIAGLPPIYGLYTAMVTPIIAALFGSSKHLVSGPTTAISLVIFASIGQLAEPGSPEFIQYALAVTLLTGVIQLALGLGRMGTLINFVSQVVVVGFTAGAAVLIMFSQLKHLLGLYIKSGNSLLKSLGLIADNIGQTNFYALAIGLGTLLVSILLRRFFPKIPNLLVGLILSTIAAYLIGGESVGLRLVGEVPNAIPSFSIPKIDYEHLPELLQSALAIAILGLMSALAIARSVAQKSGQKLDGNQEFIGQGLSNIVGGFFSCYVGAGSFTRSGVNYEAGAKTPLAAIFASILLLVILLFVAPLIAYLPIAGMAGVIMLVGYNLLDQRFMKTVAKTSKRQLAVLLVTFFSTLFLDLEYAVFVGVLTSLLFYLQQTSTPNVATMAPDPEHESRRFTYLKRKPLKECPQLKILRVDGSIFFGSLSHISSEITALTEDTPPETKFLLLQMKGVNFIDVAGCEWLVQEAKKWEEKGGGIYFTGLKKNAQDSLNRGGFKKTIGEDHFFQSKEMAIKTIYEKMDKSVCAACDTRIFIECREWEK
ncbi:MAG TPA: SulP family inorganic anion transporter [Bacteroidetes bacterium]|nr:SulP family inorganic anion transporter [Bacteroidota bacterium]